MDRERPRTTVLEVMVKQQLSPTKKNCWNSAVAFFHLAHAQSNYVGCLPKSPVFQRSCDEKGVKKRNHSRCLQTDTASSLAPGRKSGFGHEGRRRAGDQKSRGPCNITKPHEIRRGLGGLDRGDAPRSAKCFSRGSADRAKGPPKLQKLRTTSSWHSLPRKCAKRQECQRL